MTFLIVLLPIIFYFQIFGGFFQQDEWLGFSQYVLHYKLNLSQLLGYFLTPSVGHYTPLTIPVVHFLFALFGLNYQAFALVSLLLHLTVVSLFFHLTRILFRDLKLAAVATFLFGIMASDFQGTAWVIADLSTHLATIFGLLALIFLFKESIFRSLACLIVSLLFKETTIGLFFLIPVILPKNRKS